MDQSKFKHLPRAAHGPAKCPLEVSSERTAPPCLASDTDGLQGSLLLRDSHYNKGSAFPRDERKTFKLVGLLPPNVQTLDEQAARAYQQYSSRPDALAKNTFLASMREQNEVLYYKVPSPSRLFQGVCKCQILRLVLASADASERDVRHHLHPDGSRRDPELFPPLQEAGGLLSEHRRAGQSG